MFSLISLGDMDISVNTVDGFFTNEKLNFAILVIEFDFS